MSKQVVPISAVSNPLAPPRESQDRPILEMVLREEINDKVVAGPAFLREVLRDAKAKLAQLQARKEHLRSRMQALRYLAHHAEESHRRAMRPNDASRPIPISDEGHGTISGSKSPRQRSEPHSKLRRACRIALIETDQFQSCAQIYQRIQRRGSMSFERNDNPLQTLATELQAMVEHSEILSCLINGEMHWRWK